MKSLKTKITLILLLLTTITVLPLQLRADGNPGGTCNTTVCKPSSGG